MVPHLISSLSFHYPFVEDRASLLLPPLAEQQGLRAHPAAKQQRVGRNNGQQQHGTSALTNQRTARAGTDPQGPPAPPGPYGSSGLSQLPPSPPQLQESTEMDAAALPNNQPTAPGRPSRSCLHSFPFLHSPPSDAPP